MKLSLLMTSLALPSAAAAASGATNSWGTVRDFASVLADAAVGASAEDDRAYNCNTAPPDNRCYRGGYPTCCADGTCPEKKPPCDRNRRPLPGSSYCTWSPDKSCYEDGWPACCGDDDQPCPSEQPRCDVMLIGGDYCALPPDKQCYSSGRPACCGRYGGTNCPKHKPNCDVEKDAGDALGAPFLAGNADAPDWEKFKNQTKEAGRRTAEGASDAWDKTKDWADKTFNSGTGISPTFAFALGALLVQLVLV